MITPIRPQDIPKYKTQIIPKEFIEVLNGLIATNYTRGSSIVTLKEIKDTFKNKYPDMPYSTEWLNIEEIYEAAGWIVEFDKPGYNENYIAFFTFTPKQYDAPIFPEPPPPPPKKQISS